MINPKDPKGVFEQETSIALIRKDISYIQSDINDIKTVLKEGYATKDSLADVARETERRLGKLENSSNLWKWLSPTLAAVMGSIMTFLIIQYIMNT
jgi:hypothetical protein